MPDTRRSSFFKRSNYRGSQKSGSVSKLTSRKCAQDPGCQSRRANPRAVRQEQSAAPQDGLGGDCVAVMQAAYPRHGDHLAAVAWCRHWNSACRRVLVPSKMGSILVDPPNVGLRHFARDCGNAVRSGWQPTYTVATTSALNFESRSKSRKRCGCLSYS